MEKRGNIELAKAMTAGYAEAQLAKREGVTTSTEELEPFSGRTEEEQAELIYRIQSLSAQKRDILRGGFGMGVEVETEKKNNEVLPHRTAISVRRLPGGGYIPVRTTIEEGVESSRDIERHRLAEERQKTKLDDINGQLSRLGEIPGLTEEYTNETRKLYVFAKMRRRIEELEGQIVGIEAELADIRTRAREGTAGEAVGKERELMDLLEEEKNTVEQKLHEMKNTKTFGPYLERIREVSEYREAYKRGQMIEIASVKKTVDQGLSNLKNHQPFLLSGHLGSGKTAVAVHIAKKWMMMNNPDVDPEKEYDAIQPEFFSGSEEASVYDLIGKLKLATTKPDGLAVRKAVDEEVALQEEMGFKVDIERVFSRVMDARGKNVETYFAYGPLGRAIKEGKPIIIDEINAIAPEILKRLNDLMTKRPGDKVRLQENGEETFVVTPGFAIIGTLNEGTQYQGIKELSAEQIARWGQKLEVDYPTVEESFDLILAPLMRDDRPRLVSDFPIEQYDRLVDLALVVREIQDNFSGKTPGALFMSKDTNMAAEEAMLRKHVISTRDLMRKIVEVWRNSGFKEQLEEIIARNILGSTAKDARDDQQFMTELFIRHGFFSDWDEKKFVSYGITSVSESNIKALRAQFGTDEYKQVTAAQNAVAEPARARAKEIKGAMLVGNINN